MPLRVALSTLPFGRAPAGASSLPQAPLARLGLCAAGAVRGGCETLPPRR